MPSDMTEINVETYNKFIATLQIEEISLARTSAEATTLQISPGDTIIEADFGVDDDECEDDQRLCQVIARLRVDFKNRGDGKAVGHVEAAFRLRYRSEIPITGELRERFKAVNVPTNAWPYLREYIQQTLTRFGWPPFILPPYLHNESQAQEASRIPEAAAAEKSKRKPRAKK